MTDTNNTTADQDIQEPAPPLTDLQIFFIKVATVTGAFFFLMFSAYLFVSAQVEDIAILKGGPAFWKIAENKLYSFADEPDIPAAKKEKIIAALRKISDKYRPYVDAIGPSPHK